jgi:hypothetical protein
MAAATAVPGMAHNAQHTRSPSLTSCAADALSNTATIALQKQRLMVHHLAQLGCDSCSAAAAAAWLSG